MGLRRDRWREYVTARQAFRSGKVYATWRGGVTPNDRYVVYSRQTHFDIALLCWVDSATRWFIRPDNFTGLESSSIVHNHLRACTPHRKNLTLDPVIVTNRQMFYLDTYGFMHYMESLVA